jgi:hypothetical protein
MTMFLLQMEKTALEIGPQPEGNRLRLMLRDIINLRKAKWVPLSSDKQA